jgi:hypothetical protein
MIIIDLSYSVHENMTRILILTGLGFLVFGVLTESTFYASIFDATIPMLSLSIGLVLLLFGIISRTGLFAEGFRSVGGLGAILLCVSIVFFALAVASIQFQVMLEAKIAPVHFDGTSNYPTGLAHQPSLLIYSTRPFMSISMLSLETSLVLFVIGMMAIAYHHLRHAA